MERIPDWLLERYALGELPPERLAAIRARLETDPELAARLASLRADDAAFLAAWPPRRVVPGLEARVASTRGWRPIWLVPALAAAAALVVMVGRGPAPVTGGPDEAPLEVGRPKGLTPEIRVYRSAEGQVERLAPGATARAGDLLQVGYVAGGAGYGVVLSIDGNGVVTDHVVGPGGRSAALDPGGEVPLVNAYELDAAPRFERFFLVASDAPFDYAPVRSAAERLAADPAAASAPLPLPASLVQASVAVEKEGR